ncbi:hypothetical protein [Micromonospora wenchangensis]|uniref:hypothetical protein n=1 Tax=Micromonospora wenchangensis TaxID=1185415 RepID=UPI003D726B06
MTAQPGRVGPVRFRRERAAHIRTTSAGPEQTADPAATGNAHPDGSLPVRGDSALVAPDGRAVGFRSRA